MKLVVVGGGITGLAAAHRAVEVSRARSRPLELTLIEARERLGGTIATERADGFVVEAGPDSFLSEKPWALALCRRLGMEGRLIRTDDRFRKVFVWFRGRLHPLPDGFQLLAPTRLGPFFASSLFSWPGKLRMALDLFLPRGGGVLTRSTDDDESLGRFVRRRLGRQALERVAQPLVAGIYTADPEELSLRATMPRFVELERYHRSMILGLMRAARVAREEGTSGARWSLFVTLAGGMEELVSALAARLPAQSVVLKQRVSGLERAGGGWRVTTAEGSAFDADRVILASESHVAPRTEARALLAATFSSVKYPGRAPAGHVLLRGFVGGALNAEILREEDASLVTRVGGELREMLGVAAAPVLTRVARWPASMPQYHVGHLARVETIERLMASLPGLDLAGGGYRGVGIADCVHSGEAAAERALGGNESP